MRLLRLFISSTFRDMQKERDILARLVFPRQRAVLAAQQAALQEVDLRWGVTDVMSRDGGALIVCLREIAQCHPLFLGMLGRRAGWSPPRSVLESFDGGFAATVPPLASMTEIEMRYAAHLASSDPRRRFTIMVRSDRLSATIDRDEAEWTASEPLRDWALSSPSVHSIEYGSFEEFECRVEDELKRVLAAEASVVRPAPATAGLPEIPRSRDADKFHRATAARRPTLVTAERGIGSSWLVRRWVSEDPHGLYIDGRTLGDGALLRALRAPAAAQGVNPTSNARTVIGGEGDADLLTSALLDRMSRQPAARRIAFDHYEDGVTDEARADLAWIPTALPRGCSLALITRSERLRTQADDMGWQMHTIERILQDEAAAFAEKYLQLFAKYLTPQQKSLLTSAPWSTNLSSLILALDELRRYGAFETVDKRLRELAGCDSGAAMAEELIAGLTSVMPAEWSDAVKDALLAIRVSMRGLEEWEIRAAAGAAAHGSAADAAARALPSHLWSAIRISLGSSLVVRDDALLDIAGGPLLSWVDGYLVSANDSVERVSTGLSVALQQAPAVRRWTEAPRLAELRDPAHGLEALLSDPLNVQELMKVGATFAEGWLSRLTPRARRQVIAGWPTRLTAPVGAPVSETAFQLGLMAARAGENDAALQLLEWDDVQTSPATSARGDERRSLIAFLRRDQDYFQRLAWRLVNGNEPAPADEPARISAGLAVLAACAGGIAELDAGMEKALIDLLTASLRRYRDPLPECQLQIYIGQLLLMRGRWWAAASQFAAAGRAARRLGHVRLLCQSLERLAAVQLERNKFRSARQAASECRQLAFRARLAAFEALAFERQIEVERRRANWTAAYDLAAAFLARSREGLCEVDRAKAALAAIERSDSDWYAARPP